MTELRDARPEPHTGNRPYELNIVADDQPWADRAACYQPQPDRETTMDHIKTHLDPMFFIERNGSNRPAKKVCSGCPVKVQCLQWAIDNRELEHGVYGGLDPHERQQLVRDQRAAS